MSSGLMKHLCSPRTLFESWQSVRKKAGAPGFDNVSVRDFQQNERNNICRLSDDLCSGFYHPSPLRETYIPKSTPGKWRRLAIPTVKDRIVQHASNRILQSIFENSFAPCSFAYRGNMGIREAIALVREGLRSGMAWTVRGDIKGCFDEIDRPILSGLLKKIIPDALFLSIITESIEAPMVNKGFLKRTYRGIPQGSPLSPFLSNLYLHLFDKAMLSSGAFLVRYADDWLVLAPDFHAAEKGLHTASDALARLRIRLNTEKSGVYDLSRQKITFLGHCLDARIIDADQKGWKRAINAARKYRSPRSTEEFIQARSELLGIRSMYQNSGHLC